MELSPATRRASIAAFSAPVSYTHLDVYKRQGLTKALAQDLPKGMAAVPLNPGIIDTDMLRTSFGNAAGTYESPERWAVRAVRKILALILSSVQVETNDPWPCGQAAQP